MDPIKALPKSEEYELSATVATIEDLAAIMLNISQRKGFWEGGKDHNPNFVSNLHGEVSELWEAYRKSRLDEQCDKPIPLTCREEELADIIIHTLEYAAYHKVNLIHAITTKAQYNASRSWRHGGKVA